MSAKKEPVQLGWHSPKYWIAYSWRMRDSVALEWTLGNGILDSVDIHEDRFDYH